MHPRPRVVLMMAFERMTSSNYRSAEWRAHFGGARCPAISFLETAGSQRGLDLDHHMDYDRAGDLTFSSSDGQEFSFPLHPQPETDEDRTGFFLERTALSLFTYPYRAG